jgi:hypothetical protein
MRNKFKFNLRQRLIESKRVYSVEKTWIDDSWCNYTKTKTCTVNITGLHYVSYIKFRGKQDSYEIVCACGHINLMALWYHDDNIPGWKMNTEKIHVAFELLLSNFQEHELMDYHGN